jgi:hypothetical protein
MKICLYLFDLTRVKSVLKMFLSKLQGNKALAYVEMGISDKEKKFITLTHGVILVSEQRTTATVSRNSRSSNSLQIWKNHWKVLINQSCMEILK